MHALPFEITVASPQELEMLRETMRMLDPKIEVTEIALLFGKHRCIAHRGLPSVKYEEIKHEILTEKASWELSPSVYL